MFDSDAQRYGGYGNIDESVHHFTENDPLYEPHGLGWLKLYLPARSALVLKMVKKKTCSTQEESCRWGRKVIKKITFRNN